MSAIFVPSSSLVNDDYESSFLIPEEIRLLAFELVLVRLQHPRELRRRRAEQAHELRRRAPAAGRAACARSSGRPGIVLSALTPAASSIWLPETTPPFSDERRVVLGEVDEHLGERHRVVAGVGDARRALELVPELLERGALGRAQRERVLDDAVARARRPCTLRRNSVTAGTVRPRKSTSTACGEASNSLWSSSISSCFSVRFMSSPALRRGLQPRRGRPAPRGPSWTTARST